MKLARADLQAVFGNNPRVIARFEALDLLVDALEAKAVELGVSVESATAKADEATSRSVQPLNGWLTALSGLPYNQAGAIELRGGNVVSVRAIDTDDSASLATRALVMSHFGGSVKSVSVVTANGVSGTVATATTTPAITLTLGAITPSSVAATGNVTGLNLSGTNTGDQTITLTGDVTGFGTGSFAATIAANAVTYAKLQDVSATGRFLGRISALAGDAEELTGAQATSLLDTATTILKGLMSAADKTKLDGVATGATANATDAQLRDRATHTGTQAASTLTGTLTLPVASAGAVTSASPTAGIGYATGAGGSVTQITSKTTSITLNKMCGQITTHNAALAAGAVATFAVNNSGVDGDDTIDLNIAQGGATGQNYRFWVAGVDVGVFYITLENRSAGSLAEAVRFNFAIKKGVTT